MTSTSAQVTTLPSPVRCDLEWTGDLRFASRTATLVLDSEGADGPTPMQAFASALAACMGMDVVHFLARSRVPATSMRISLSGKRAPEPPSRSVDIAMHFEIGATASEEQVERAVALSREKYCSVWNSMNTDIPLQISSTVIRP